jgi:S1-C subfamily serine protease
VRARAAAVVAAAALACGGCGGGDDAGAPPPPPVFAVTVPGALVAAEVGTGFAAGDGRVVTVAHVVAGARAVRVGGRPARVALEERRLDLATVAVPGLRAPALRTAATAAGAAVTVRVLRGRAVRTLRGRVRRTITAHVRPAPGARSVTRPALELAVRVRRGDSGAPVLDAGGRVVGVVFAQAADRGDLAYAVAAGALAAVLR